ncbi:MAG: c-type cytochrome domain-containing protein [Verrucomicrobiaceae bacterium]
MRFFSVLPLVFGVLPAAEKITYEDHIFPIFESACLNCHNPDKKKGGLDLSTYQGVTAGGSGGKIALAGDGGSSKLFTVTVHTEEPVMPPEGDKIEKKNADLIRAWIDGGLLETKSSKARKPSKPAISLTATGNAQTKPEGPLPMPADLLLEPVLVPRRDTVVNDMDASPWAPLLAVTSQKQVLLYHTDSLELVGILPFPKGNPETVSFHPGGKYLIAGGGIGGKSGSTVTWDITTGQVIMTMGKEFDSVLAADLRADLGGIALGGPSRFVKLWDTQANEEIAKIKKHTDWLISLKYSPDGVLLATGGRGNGVQVWEAATGNEFHSLRGHQGGIIDLKWRADSNLLASASSDGDIVFWDMNSGNQVKKQRAHNGGVLAMDYARDGQLASSGRDKRVKIWKPDLGLKKELPAFKEDVTEVEFSHDSKRIFTADWNGEIKVWENDSFKEVGTLDANPPAIATRLVELKGQTSTLAKSTADLRADLSKKEKAMVDAANWVTWLEKKIPELNNQKKGMEQEIAKLNDLWNRHNTEQESLQKHLQQQSQELQQIRESLGGLEEQRAKAAEELVAAKKTDDPSKIAQIEKALGNLDADIKNSRDDMDKRQGVFNKTRDDHKVALQKRETAGSARQSRQEELKSILGEIPQREKELDPARKGKEWTAKVVQETKSQIIAAEKSEANHLASIARWQAAQINTELIATEDLLTAAAAQLENMRSDLQLAAKDEKIDAIRELKTRIDTASSTHAELLSRRDSLKTRYEASKTK